MDSMYEILMGLPLFNGVSYNRISEIVGSTPLSFLKYLPGEPVINAGEACTQLKFIISGSVRISVANHNDRFKVDSTLRAPSVIMPDYLFGRTTVYPCKATAVDTVSIMQISKQEFTRLLRNDEVFLFNFLNILSSDAQKAVDGVMALSTGSLEERLAYWILALTQRDSTEIVMSCKQRDLYSVFGVQRSSFIAMLDSLAARGIIKYSPGEIRILSRELLANLLLSSHD